MPTSTTTRLAALLGVCALALLAGCGGDDDAGGGATTVAPAPAATATASTAATTTAADQQSATAATMVPAPTAAPDGTPYSTKQFVQPLDLVVPPWLFAEPTEDSAHFVTFAAPDESLAIRILLPVLVYQPGQAGTTPPPDDYVSYLMSQAEFGAEFSDRVDTTVDGHPATLVWASTSSPLDGSLGCPDEGIEADSCFGIQPDRLVRLAVITTDAGPLLIWLRTNAEDNPDTVADAKLFDDLLATVKFADRQPEEQAENAAGPLDGTYTWTITRDDAVAHGTPSDQTPEGLAVFPDTFTVTIDKGTWDMTQTSSSDSGHGAVEVNDDRAVFHWDLDTFTFDFARDADGTLHLTPAGGLRDGDVFIWTTEPWTPVASPIEGTFGWTLTTEDAINDPNYDPDNLDTYPWTFSITFAADGTCSGYHLEDTTRYEDGTCTYETTGDRLDVYWQGNHQAFNYTADPDGTLHMTAIPPIDPGDNYVTTTKPWIPE
jgi:hypothetical protein